MRTDTDRSSPSPAGGDTPLVTHARFRIGDVVRHRLHGFRGVVFDVDPVFANSEEWYESIPEAARPAREQPFYHLFADNDDGSYIAYVSQQNLDGDDDRDEPLSHPAIEHLFRRDAEGRYRMLAERYN